MSLTYAPWDLARVRDLAIRSAILGPQFDVQSQATAHSPPDKRVDFTNESCQSSGLHHRKICYALRGLETPQAQSALREPVPTIVAMVSEMVTSKLGNEPDLGSSSLHPLNGCQTAPGGINEIYSVIQHKREVKSPK